MKYGAWVEKTIHEFHEVEAESPDAALEMIRAGRSTLTDTQETHHISDVEKVL
jgi:hypothetical protein